MGQNVTGIGMAGLLVVAVGGYWYFTRKPEPPTPPIKNPAARAMPFAVPAGAAYAREEMDKGKNSFILYTITFPNAAGGLRQIRQKEALAGCAQSVTSRNGWSATEPNNFIHLSGPCLGRTFGHPGKTIGPYTACTVDFKDEGKLTVTDCLVDGTYVLAIMYELQGFPYSTTKIAVPR